MDIYTNRILTILISAATLTSPATTMADNYFVSTEFLAEIGLQIMQKFLFDSIPSQPKTPDYKSLLYRAQRPSGTV